MIVPADASACEHAMLSAGAVLVMEVSNTGFITVHGLNEGCITPYEDIDAEYGIIQVFAEASMAINFFNSSPPGQNGRHFADDISNAFSWLKSLNFYQNFTEVYS